MNFRKSILLLIALGMLAALVGCGGGSHTTPPPTIAITANSGGYTTPQPVGSAFGKFSVTVTSNGSPLSGASVTFTAPNSGASGTFATNPAGITDTETTNASGVATSQIFTANNTTGSYSVSATTSGATTPATFNLTNTAAPTVTITANAGYTSSAAVGGSFGTFSATVMSNGNPVSGASVTFTAPTAGAGVATGTFAPAASNQDTETTNASGVATSQIFTAGTVAGSYAVTATTPNATTPATFNLTNNAGPAATITVNSGNNQTAALGGTFASALSVKVVDSDGNVVNNAPVTFTVVPGTGGIGASFATTGTTDTENTGTNGIYTTSHALTANLVFGSFTVNATVSGVSAPATFTLNNALAPGNYVFSLGGMDSGSSNCANVTGETCLSDYFVAGVFTVDSSGANITAGELDFSDYNYFKHEGITSGSIAASPSLAQGDLNLIITINTGDVNIGPGAGTGAGSGTLVVNAAMVTGSKALISEYDSWASSSGDLNFQTSTAALCPSASSTTPCGYAFTIGGVDGSETPLAIGGVIAIDGSGGTIDGTGSIFDLNDGGILDSAQPFSSGAVSTPDASGFFTLSLNTPFYTLTGFPSIQLDSYIIDANHIRVVENWLNDALRGTTGGTLLAQTGTGTFSSSSIAGSSYVIRTFGHNSSTNGVLQVAGVLNFQSDGSVTGNVSFNDLTIPSPQGGVALEAESTTTPCSSGSATTACYTVDSEGDVTLTNVTDGATFDYNLQLYLTGDGHALVISMDSAGQPISKNDVLTGNAWQQASGLTISSLSGDYALGVGGFASGGEYNGDGVIGIAAASTSIAGYLDENDSLSGGGLVPDKGFGATYAATSTYGVINVTGTGSNATPFTLYVIGPSDAVIIENDTQRLTLGYLQ